MDISKLIKENWVKTYNEQDYSKIVYKIGHRGISLILEKDGTFEAAVIYFESPFDELDDLYFNVDYDNGFSEIRKLKNVEEANAFLSEAFNYFKENQDVDKSMTASEWELINILVQQETSNSDWEREKDVAQRLRKYIIDNKLADI